MTVMVSRNTQQSWFLTFKPNPRADIRLFCFPYAGGVATHFRSWPNTLPSFIEVVSAQPPGRGGRISEAPFMHLTPMVRVAAEVITPLLDKPFAFFGHSMGAMISFELARLLRNERGLEPIHLFVSGRGAPQVETPPQHTFELPDEEFIAELHRLNGTPREVLEHAELMQLMLPLLRADFSVSQTYQYTPDAPLSCPVTVFGGLMDETKREQLEGWREQTTSQAFSLRMFSGDHFFLHAAQTDILRIISQQLRGRL
jgi:medium-chain acyl-[acyl-carrier-protein] hydrolase